MTTLTDVRYCVIMPAAGTGQRMAANATKPKQYLQLLDKTVIEWSLSVFLNDERCVAIVVALAKDDPHWATLAIADHPKIRLATGGAERVHSVRNGLSSLQGDSSPNDWASEWVLVHDAARPCLQRSDVDALITAVTAEDQSLAGGLLAIPVADTLKQTDGKQRVISTVPRHGLWRAQTPQMFRFDVLRRALQSAHTFNATDESSTVEFMGYQPRIIEGRVDNIKITVADDLKLAEYILQARKS